MPVAKAKPRVMHSIGSTAVRAGKGLFSIEGTIGRASRGATKVAETAEGLHYGLKRLTRTMPFSNEPEFARDAREEMLNFDPKKEPLERSDLHSKRVESWISGDEQIHTFLKQHLNWDKEKIEKFVSFLKEMKREHGDNFVQLMTERLQLKGSSSFLFLLAKWKEYKEPLEQQARTDLRGFIRKIVDPSKPPQYSREAIAELLEVVKQLEEQKEMMRKMMGKQ